MIAGGEDVRARRGRTFGPAVTFVPVLLRRILPWTLSLGCEASPAASVARVQPPRFAFEACELPGTDRAARCASLDRPQDPTRADGGTIAIHFAIVDARGAALRPPLYFFAGGPGQGASSAFGPVLAHLDALAEDRDLVLVDQRGTGRSSPLRCEPAPNSTIADRLARAVDRAELEACLAGYDVDPRNFTTAIATDDLEAIRAALEHSQIDLIGASYGARAAMVYARAHPDRVRHMVLDGVPPVDMALPSSFARDADVALADLLDDCAAYPECDAAFPEAALRFRRWFAELRTRPRSMTLHDAPTGEVQTVDVTAGFVAATIADALYIPSLAAMLPLALHRAEQGDLDVLLEIGEARDSAGSDDFSTGLFYTVLCAEDVPWIDDAALAEQVAGTFLGTDPVDELREICRVWPRAELPAGYRDPVALATPTLVLSGGADPVTPGRWGAHALAHLSAGRHVVVSAAAHGTLQSPCVASIVQAFLDDVEPADPSCATAGGRPSFVLRSAAG